ncbi:MAG: hypothetical protein U0414_37580 [Polyangiaceae bacterium]
MRMSPSRYLGLSLGMTTVIGLSLLPTTGCLNRPVEPVEPKTTKTVIEKIKQEGVDKIDLLLAIDNSASMADKQEILAKAVPDLVERLVNPLCVDGSGNLQPTQPTDPTAACDTANGFDREFPPIVDINIGIVSSSLGGLGADQCLVDATHNNDDKGELLSRKKMGGSVPTYMSQGFLAWDPNGARSGTEDKNALVQSLTDMVKGVDQVGCGYEMQLESIYRFLIDPAPYSTLVKGNPSDPYSGTTKDGVDQTILDQRAAFLRPDSLVAILILSDENDCSVVAGGQAYSVFNSAGFFKGAPVCDTDPGNKCCYSCALMPPPGCPADPACGPPVPKYNTQAGEDSVNLRCWHEQQKYGFNALYPVARYINAFGQLAISLDNPDGSLSSADGKYKTIPNPLFTSQRGPELVFVAGIVGVPWQAVAKKDGSGNPDLSLGFQPFGELDQNGFFTEYVGDPDKYVEPTNPIMVETYENRGVAASEPNGGDRTINMAAPDDLQYACIFPLEMPVDPGPDCGTKSAPDSPLCDPAKHSKQINAKAYPGTRELAVLHGLGVQGIPASICPANINNPTLGNGDPDPSFGYRPAIKTIVDRLKEALSGKCLPFKLKPAPDGSTPCVVIEAAHEDDPARIGVCDAVGRQKVDPAHQPAVEAAKADAFAPTGDFAWNSFCEITQLGGAFDDDGTTNDPDKNGAPSDRYECQNLDAVPASINGWCYVDATTVPPYGNPGLQDFGSCGDNEKRLVRFVNGGNVAKGATAFITCSGEGAL